MERVSVIHGKSPVLLVAPHGYDDTNTDILTEFAAKTCGGSAVINRGWERDDKVDVLNDKANCNKIQHAKHDVVKDEFYDPMIKMQKRIAGKHPKTYIFHIHGCGNDIRKKTGENLSVIIGWGAGDKPRPTCERKIRDLFTWLIEKDRLWLPAQAGPGSKFAAWDRNNLLQEWPMTIYYKTAAMQLEFVTSVRATKADAETSGNYLGDLINNLIKSDGVLEPPKTYTYFRVNL